MVNIYDVAKKAQVSIATVSNVINNKDKEVSEKVKKQIMDAMEELGYVPSKVAIGLARGETKIIGVVVSDINNLFFSEVVRVIEDQLYKLNFDLFLIDTHYDLSKSKGLIDKLISSNVNGILLLNNEVDFDVVKKLSKNKIPTILYGWGITNDYVGDLVIDFKSGMKAAVKKLYDLNHRNILFINSKTKLKTFEDRFNAFLHAVDELNLKDLKFEIIDGESTIPGGVNIVKKIISLKKFKPTVIMCVNDIQAIGILFSFHSHGINVPNDMSLIGLDNIYLSSVVSPKLTTIDLSAKRVGKNILEMLFSMIEDKNKKGFEKVIETKFLLRDSLAKK
jgi:LacI family transcriptional regulator